MASLYTEPEDRSSFLLAQGKSEGPRLHRGPVPLGVEAISRAEVSCFLYLVVAMSYGQQAVQP